MSSVGPALPWEKIMLKKIWNFFFLAFYTVGVIGHTKFKPNRSSRLVGHRQHIYIYIYTNVLFYCIDIVFHLKFTHRYFFEMKSMLSSFIKIANIKFRTSKERVFARHNLKHSSSYILNLWYFKLYTKE